MHRDEPTLADSSSELLLRAGFANTPESVTVLRASFSSDDPRHRILALRGLVRQSLATDDDWSVALGDHDVEVQREALTLIAYEDVETDALIARMIEMLDDTDALVVDGAVFALGEHLVNDAVDRLCDVAMHHDDARCRESAVAALGAIGDDRARTAIFAALNDKPPVRRRAIVSLSNFEGPDIDAALERAAEDRDWQVRAAVNQLGREPE